MNRQLGLVFVCGADVPTQQQVDELLGQDIDFRTRSSAETIIRTYGGVDVSKDDSGVGLTQNTAFAASAFARIHAPQFKPDQIEFYVTEGLLVIKFWHELNIVGAEVRCLTTLADQSCPTFSPNGRLLATSGRRDGTVRLWKMPDGQPLEPVLRHKNSAGREAAVSLGYFSPDGGLLATLCDRSVRLWRMPECQSLKPILAHRTWLGRKREVSGLYFSPDGRLLATCAWDGQVRLWSVPEGQLLKTLFGHNRSLAISPDGRLLATSSWRDEDEPVRLWSIPGGNLVKSLRSGAPLVISPDGRFLASASSTTVELWDLPAAQTEVRLATGPEYYGEYRGDVECLRFSPDGRVLAAGLGDGTVLLWSLPWPGFRPFHTFKAKSGFDEGLCFLCFSPDGQLLITGYDEGMLRLWGLHERRCLHTFGEPGLLRSVQMSPDGRLLASSTVGLGVRIWSMPTRLTEHVNSPR